VAVILITGSIVAKPETLDELKRLCLEHTRRSREEPGCELHAVHVDAENALRLVFIERWADRASVLRHFAEPSSRAFIASARKLGAEPPNMNLYASEEIALGKLGSGV
jgi:quinol monooxygenase YgiN